MTVWVFWAWRIAPRIQCVEWTALQLWINSFELRPLRQLSSALVFLFFLLLSHLCSALLSSSPPLTCPFPASSMLSTPSLSPPLCLSPGPLCPNCTHALPPCARRWQSRNWCWVDGQTNIHPPSPLCVCLSIPFFLTILYIYSSLLYFQTSIWQTVTFRVWLCFWSLSKEQHFQALSVIWWQKFDRVWNLIWWCGTDVEISFL